MKPCTKEESFMVIGMLGIPGDTHPDISERDAAAVVRLLKQLNPKAPDFARHGYLERGPDADAHGDPRARSRRRSKPSRMAAVPPGAPPVPRQPRQERWGGAHRPYLERNPPRARDLPRARVYGAEYASSTAHAVARKKPCPNGPGTLRCRSNRARLLLFSYQFWVWLRGHSSH